MGGPVSDSFDSASLAAMWSFTDPVGNCSHSSPGGSLQITVPAATNHDPNSGGVNNSARIVQAISNVDFDIEAKFDSMPTTQLQEMGIAVEQDSTNWLRISFGRFTSFYVSINKILAGTQTQLSSTTPSTGGATSVWSRLVRVGNVWTHSYSFDGKTYVQTVQFTQALTIADVGVYSANQNGTPANAPAFTAIIDYFLGSKFTPSRVRALQSVKRSSVY